MTLQVGWIIEDRHIRIKVKSISFCGYCWDVNGMVLNKDNSPHKRRTSEHTIRVVNLESLHSSIKVISK